MKGKRKQIDFNALVERYRWWIGSILLIAIIISGGYLLWRENNNGKLQISDDKYSELEAKVLDSELRIQQLEKKVAEAPSNNQATNEGSNEAVGQVAGTSTASSSVSSQVTGKVNLNNATLAQLDTLPGIGPAYAQRIVDYRQSHGGFKNITELKNIKGIGEKTFEKLKDLVSI